MKQRFVLLAFALCSLLNASVAQQPDQWQEYFQTLLDDDDDLQTSIDEVYDLLSDLAATPRNINTASREDLEELPFLTPWQVESICEYIYKYGGMLTIDELAMIESLDSTRRGLLRCFFYAALLLCRSRGKGRPHAHPRRDNFEKPPRAYAYRQGAFLQAAGRHQRLPGLPLPPLRQIHVQQHEPRESRTHRRTRQRRAILRRTQSP